MPITDLVAPEAILPALKVISKKQALAGIVRARRDADRPERARRSSRCCCSARSSAPPRVGGGIAIPHGKLPKLDRIFGMFARLERPIDFEAMDGQPVDLIFLLLAPEGAGADHLKALAKVARLMRDQDLPRKLRASRDAQALYAVLSLPPATAA